MRLSHVKQIPNFMDLNISEQNRKIKLSDKVIFKDLQNDNRTLEDTKSPAKKGNYVHAVATREGEKPKEIHVEIGTHHFPGYEEALLGCTKDQVFSKTVYGKETEFRILSVRQTKELELIDENIEKLHLSGIHTVADYREDYVLKNKDDILERVFQALRRKLTLELDKILDVELVDSEVDDYNQGQRNMIECVVGDVEERLLAAYGENGKYSLEESEQLFKQENTRNFKLIVLGDALAEKNQLQITEEEKASLIENYKMVYGKSDEEIETENLMDKVFEAFYLQYAIKELKNHFASVAEIIVGK